VTEKFLPVLRTTLGRATCVAPATKRVDGKTLLDSSRDTLAGTTPRAGGNLCRTPLRPYRGRLRHPGWLAGKVDLPQWTGSPSSATVVASAEVEL